MTIQKLPKVGMRGGEDQRENQRNIIVQEIERVMISQECTDSGKKKYCVSLKSASFLFSK